ncbi:DUF4349 domain-containing protein [Kitasatospora sp. NPDC092286]|uniref:DUF4349 domain-containing protein n=1 Tax=Kitasatospora sp. NPDC092286 TaxID=3364087 RepID=UPI003804D5DA
MVRGRRRPGALAAGVVAAALLVGGCGAAERNMDARAGGDSAARKDEAPAAAAAPAAGAAQSAAPAGAGGTAGAGQTGQATGQPGAVPAADTRLIAYTAQLSLRTTDVSQVLARARELAAAAGGYIGGETVNGGAPDGRDPYSAAPRPGGPLNGQITLKVPSAAFQQTLDQLSALGEVLSRKSQADDVTQQVADVASRVQSQQASVERVRALMGQAKSLADITSLESELSRREADLESLQKQQKELAARTSLSTLTLDARREPTPAHTDAPDAPKQSEEGFWHSVGSALGGGWDVLVTIVRGLAIAVAAVAPFLLVLGPAAFAFWFLRRRRAAKLPPRPAHAPGRPGFPAGPEAEETVEEEEERYS